MATLNWANLSTPDYHHRTFAERAFFNQKTSSHLLRGNLFLLRMHVLHVSQVIIKLRPQIRPDVTHRCFQMENWTGVGDVLNASFQIAIIRMFVLFDFPQHVLERAKFLETSAAVIGFCGLSHSSTIQKALSFISNVRHQQKPTRSRLNCTIQCFGVGMY